MSANQPTCYRRDQASGVTPPDLSKICTHAEHINKARGKKSQYTSVTQNVSTCLDFGEVTYEVRSKELQQAGHKLILHNELLRGLREMATHGRREEKQYALLAMRRVQSRQEGLIDWSFEIGAVPKSQLISFAWKAIQCYFKSV